MVARQILIVSADERWLRVLEVTIRLGGAETISRRSVVEALRNPVAAGEHPTTIVVDLGAQTSAAELDDVRGLVRDNRMPAVVILPDQLLAEREALEAIGATVLVRPYRPSDLYAALSLAEPGRLGAGVGGEDEPRSEESGPLEAPPGPG